MYTLEEAKRSVGPGWAKLVEECWYVCKNSKSPITIMQVKEKFGTLRFYVGYASEEILDLINKYEDESAFICEQCGNKGYTTKLKGWLRTLCDTCRIKELGYD